MGRIILLVTSPRIPAGLLCASAWQALRAHAVFAGGDTGLTEAVRAAGIEVALVDAGHAADTLLAAAGDGAVWLADPGGDQALAREVGLRLARAPGTAQLELIYGSWDPPGARLLDVVTAMDRLVSPGGDPWKRAQTHQSLAHFLLEEAYEAYDAIVADDLPSLREELGDVLMQVVLHARMAQEASVPWSIDDLAADLTEKLIRRNPHVFAGEPVADVDEIVTNWERIKQEEKSRKSTMDGIALSQPALALAAKVLARAGRIGSPVPLPAVPVEPALPPAVPVEPALPPAVPVGPALPPADQDEFGDQLLHVVARARARGLDAEGALRRAALRYADRIRSAETGSAETGSDGTGPAGARR